MKDKSTERRQVHFLNKFEVIKIFQRKIKSNIIKEKDDRLDNLKLEMPTKKTTLNFPLKDKGKKTLAKYMTN